VSQPRILIFDIEATALNASFGYALCMGYMYHGQSRVVVPTIYDFPPKRGEEPDAGLMRHLHSLITNEADIIVSWYGKEYDRKFLNTRMLMSGLAPMPPLNAEHVDLYYTARGNFAFHSNRLQSVSEAMECPWSKTPVRADVWRKAMRGDAKAFAYVVDHCKLDVKILDWIYGRIKGYVRQHPWMGRKGIECRVCGSAKLHSRGYTVTTGGAPRQRFQCQDCGAWSQAPARKAA
jgi:uncharacterized protein YprB with RNaseH-like and TPR domain